jgi:hypothetical protein
LRNGAERSTPLPLTTSLTDPEGLWAAQVVDGFERPPKNVNDYVRENESRVVKATLAPDYRTVYLATWRGQVVYGPEFQTERDAWTYLARCDSAGRII